MLVAKYKLDNLASLHFPSLIYIFRLFSIFDIKTLFSTPSAARGHRGGGGGTVGTSGVKDTRQTQPTASTRQGSWELIETEEAIMQPEWVCAKSSAYTL